jgi:transcriptional regulator with XRE-family HTH domain
MRPTEKATGNAAGVVMTGRDSDDPMSEGEKLAKLLKSTNRTQKQLAAGAGVSTAAVHRWLNTPEFSLRMWRTIADGLQKIGLNPREIRPEFPIGPIGTAQQDLTKIVVGWPREQLRQLKTVLEADGPSRDILLAYINGALHYSEE